MKSELNFGHNALQVFVSNNDLAAEACVDADVFQVGCFLWVGVQHGFKLTAFPRFKLRVGGPNRGGLDHQGFAVSVERIGHKGLCFLENSVVWVNSQYTDTRTDQKDTITRMKIPSESRDLNTMQSGTKLVLGIFGLALAAGIFSWWYRFEVAHRSTTFWGPQFADLIVRPSDVTAFGLKPTTVESGEDTLQILSQNFERIDSKDLTSAPGMVHLRNSILTDGNYRWDEPVSNEDWRWCLQFSGEGMTATILFSENFAVLGRMNQRGDNVRTVDCQPMAETLREYFAEIGVFDKTASNQAE